MRVRQLKGLCMAAAAASAMVGAAAHASDADRAAIIAGEQRMCGMTNMSQTIDDTIGFYDEKVIQFDVMPEPLVGQAAVRASLAKQYARVKNLKCRIEGLRVGVDGDLGYAFSIQHFEADGTDGGPYENAQLFDAGKSAKAATRVKMTWRQTDIWQKKNGKWTMLHQHSSFPIELATGEPVMDMPDSYGK